MTRIQSQRMSKFFWGMSPISTYLNFQDKVCTPSYVDHLAKSVIYKGPTFVISFGPHKFSQRTCLYKAYALHFT